MLVTHMSLDSLNQQWSQLHSQANHSMWQTLVHGQSLHSYLAHLIVPAELCTHSLQTSQDQEATHSHWPMEINSTLPIQRALISLTTQSLELTTQSLSQVLSMEFHLKDQSLLTSRTHVWTQATCKSIQLFFQHIPTPCTTQQPQQQCGLIQYGPLLPHLLCLASVALSHTHGLRTWIATQHFSTQPWATTVVLRSSPSTLRTELWLQILHMSMKLSATWHNIQLYPPTHNLQSHC